MLDEFTDINIFIGLYISTFVTNKLDSDIQYFEQEIIFTIEYYNIRVKYQFFLHKCQTRSD